MDNRSSTFGYYVFQVGNLVIWRSKGQYICIRSSVKAEYKMVVMGVTKLLWLKIMLKDKGIVVREPMKYEDVP